MMYITVVFLFSWVFLKNKEKIIKEEDKLKFKELKKDYIKQNTNMNDMSHRDIKQKLQVFFRIYQFCSFLRLEIRRHSKNG